MKKILKARADYFNIQDFAVFVQYFFLYDAIDDDIKKIIPDMFKELYTNIDQNCFAKLTSNFAQNINENKLSKRFLKYWSKSLKFLIKSKKIRGRYLDQLRQEAKKIQDKTLKEKILNELRDYKPF